MEWKTCVFTLLALLSLVVRTQSTNSDLKSTFADLSLSETGLHPEEKQSDEELAENGLEQAGFGDLLKRGSLFRFGKRGGSLLRFGKRGSLLRFGKRGSLFRFGKRGSSSLFRYGKRDSDDIYDLLSNGDDQRNMLRQDKRSEDGLDNYDIEEFLNRYNKRQNILRYGRSADKRPHTPFRFGREEDE